MSVQFSLEMCLAAHNRQKIHKTPYFSLSRLSKVTAISANEKLVYDFLLVINNNLGLIPYRF